MNPKFVAEVSSNHHRSLDRCLEFVDVSANIGCYAVKFQLFKIRSLFAPEAFVANKNLHKREKWELPVSYLKPIAARCKKRKIKFSCTPFHIGAVNDLAPFVDFYKIASYELLHDKLLSACAKTGKPVVLSVGMATMLEIDHAVKVIRSAGCKDLTLLHCFSGYPAPPELCNLSFMATLKKHYKCEVGWSDHSVNEGVLYHAALQWNASMIEFHLDLDKKGEEYKSGHCWLPSQMKKVIDTLKIGLVCNGDGKKKQTGAEKKERHWRSDPSDGMRPLMAIRRRIVK